MGAAGNLARPVTAPTPAPSRADGAEPPLAWGLGEVVVAIMATFVVSAVLGSIVFAVAGVQTTDEASLVTIALVQTTLWVGMVGAVAYVLRRKGASLGLLGFRFRLLDVPLGVAVGVACQLVLVPLISTPWTALTEALGWSDADIREPACRLAEKADDPVGVLLLFAITVIGAPIVEELFFRGFVQKAAIATFTRHLPDDPDAARTAVRFGTWFGLVLTAVLFGVVHFQLQQAPALVAFGLVLGVMAHRSGRLGPGIVAHMAFNATTIVTLVVLSSANDDQCAKVLDGLVRALP